MAFPKHHIFSEQLQKLAFQCRIFGSPARLEILRKLNESQKNVVELGKDIPLCQGTISAHLQRLRKAGVIEVEVQGLYNKYGMDLECVERMAADLEAFARELRSVRKEAGRGIMPGKVVEPRDKE